MYIMPRFYARIYIEEYMMFDITDGKASESVSKSRLSRAHFAKYHDFPQLILRRQWSIGQRYGLSL